VSVRTDNPTMRAQVKKAKAAENHRQWDDDEFEPIAKALDEVFKAQKLLKEKPAAPPKFPSIPPPLVVQTPKATGEAMLAAGHSWQERTGEIWDHPKWPYDPEEFQKNWGNPYHGRSMVKVKEDPEYFEKLNQAVENEFVKNERFKQIVDANGAASVTALRGEGKSHRDFATNSTAAAQSAGFQIQMNYANRKWLKDDPTPPKPGRSVLGEDTGTVLRHEYGHTVWDIRLTKDERKDFMDLVKDPKVISSYAASLNHEVFPEALALITHPQYVRSDFPEWIGALEDWMLATLTKSKQ